MQNEPSTITMIFVLLFTISIFTCGVKTCLERNLSLNHSYKKIEKLKHFDNVKFMTIESQNGKENLKKLTIEDSILVDKFVLGLELAVPFSPGNGRNTGKYYEINFFSKTNDKIFSSSITVNEFTAIICIITDISKREERCKVELMNPIIKELLGSLNL